MRRREFTLILGGAIILAGTPRAQQRTIPVIGFFVAVTPDADAAYEREFRQGLAETGYIDGQNLKIEYRWADGHYDRLPAFAAEFVSREVDLIFAAGGNLAALAAKNATLTIPIVFVTGGDPVADGVVASLARPNGNLTGFTILTVELTAKKLDLLSELVPQAAVIALLVNPNFSNTEGVIRDAQEVARARGMRLHVLRAGTASEIDDAFSALVELHAGALLVGSDPFFLSRREQLVTLAARRAVPALYEWREFAVAGGLISYGASVSAAFRQAGIYAGRILKGANPVDLPVQQPTTFELAVNLKTARALGLTIPPSILARADEVIE